MWLAESQLAQTQKSMQIRLTPARRVVLLLAIRPTESVPALQLVKTARPVQTAWHLAQQRPQRTVAPRSAPIRILLTLVALLLAKLLRQPAPARWQSARTAARQVRAQLHWVRIQSQPTKIRFRSVTQLRNARSQTWQPVRTLPTQRLWVS